MDAVIIGVSDKSILWRHGSLEKEQYENLVQDYAGLLSNYFDNLILTPDEGVYSDIAKAFGKIKGEKPIAFIPDKDEKFGTKHLQYYEGFEIRGIDGDWYKLNAELVTKGNVVICIGFSPGSLIELGYIKYQQKFQGKDIKLFVDKRFIEKPLPKSFEEQIKNLFYFNDLSELESLLKSKLF